MIEVGGESPFKVIALGAGDGYRGATGSKPAVALQNPDIELLLFDISQPLLTTAYQHAIDTFGEQSAVHTLLVHGNFHDLAQYPQVSYTPAKGRRQRIYTMLGYTLNLDSEPRFSSTASRTVSPATCSSSTFQQGRPREPADEIRRQDPAFHHPFQQGLRRLAGRTTAEPTVKTTCHTSSRFSS